MDDDAVDALYGLPLDEFVAARNALAKERRDKEIRMLRKPSVAAWAVNQLARGHGDAVAAVLDAADILRRAQRRALSGGGGDALRDATRAHRRAVDAALGRLRSVLPGPTSAVSERVRATLAAASTDDELAATLRAGRLVDDVAPAGFGDVTGLEILAAADEEETAADTDTDAGVAEPDEARARRADAERERTAAERALREAEARADEAVARVREAEREVRRAEKRLASLDPRPQRGA